MTDREKIYELSGAICKGCKTLHECDTENCAMSEIVAEYLFKNDYRKMDEVRKETAKDILQMIDENKFNVGKALYDQSIEDDCDVVSPYGLKVDIARKYGVEIDE